MGNKYQQAFYELVEHVEQLQVLLGKTLVSTSPRQNIMILTDVWSHANVAQAELNKLPLSAASVFQTAKFLSQTGDYAHVMAKQNAEGRVLSDENRKKLNELRQYAAQISDSLHDLETQVFSGEVNWLELVQGTKSKIGKEEKQNSNPLNDNFDDISDELNKYPTLIYDGPFSDHIREAEPKGLKGDEISKEGAKRKVIELVDFKDNSNLKISDGTTVSGKIVSYNFQVKSEDVDSGYYSVDISKKGGHLVALLNDRVIDSSKITQKDALDKAQDYLASKGYPNMAATYSEVNDNIAYISFAYKPDNIIYYPDIINIQVALDNGQIIAVEALSYLMSHHERKEEKPKISLEEVRNLTSSTLEKIENIQLAVIPQPSLAEVLTYEVRGTIGKEVYLIYINAQTGDEEQILKVIKGEQGTFVL